MQREITDRFTAAVGELGSDSEEVRLGGIYALERIAHDSERDQSVVIEVLCAYVRKHAPRSALITAEVVTSSPRQIPTSTAASRRLETDVQAAVTVGARLELRDQRDVLDLSHANLTGVDLDNLGNGLGPARLSGANLEGTDLTEAHLGNTDLGKSDLKNAHLVNTDLHSGRFANSDLTSAYLEGVLLNESIFTGAILSRAALVNVELSGADFSNAYLVRTRLIGANLSGATFVNAHLTAADLMGADLAGANLSGADLSGADLTGARNVTLKQLQPARTDHLTKLPTGFIWTERGVQVQEAKLPR